jgi:hypothetical protein
MMSDAFALQFLGSPNTRDVLKWLGESTETDFRSIGELSSTEESIAFAKEIYDAGAVEVLAVEIDDYPDEGQNTGKLLIKLPNGSEERTRVFARAGQISQTQGFDPATDSGQSYLFVMLD